MERTSATDEREAPTSTGTKRPAAPSGAERAAGGEHASNPQVLAAARSDLLFELGVVKAMRHFNLRHGEVRAAMTIALATRRPEEITRARKKADAFRLRRSAVRAEVKYPGVHRKTLAAFDESGRGRGKAGEKGESASTIGEAYGVSREYIRQLRKQLDALAQASGASAPSLIGTIEKAATAARRGKSPAR